MMIETPRLIL